MTETTPPPVATPRVYTEQEMATLQAGFREVEAKANGIRLDRDNHKAAAAKALADLEAATAAHTAKLTATEQRAIRADLKAALALGGAVDLDAVKLMDMAAVKLNADGDVENAAEMVAALKAAKPHLFGKEPAAKTTTTQTEGAPKPGEPKAKNAMDMTDEEWAAEKARLTKRRA
jgi:hypothetical protein